LGKGRGAQALSALLEMLGGILGGLLSPSVKATDESIERWRQRPFLLRWTPIVIGLVLIPLAFIGLLVWLLMDSL
jgi:hypothetical protein